MTTTTEPYPKTKRNRVLRQPKRGNYDREAVNSVLDAAVLAHVGFVMDDQPFVIPMLHARDGDTLLLHGSSASRTIRHLAAGNPACITVTIVDGLVLARSVFHHSINYRSAVLYGSGYIVADPDEKMAAMTRFTERLIPGRWDDTRPPNRKEFKATGVIAIPIESASAKVRIGPPVDDEEDMSLPVWAGVIPVQQTYGAPWPDPAGDADRDLPDYLQHFLAQSRSA